MAHYVVWLVSDAVRLDAVRVVAGAFAVPEAQSADLDLTATEVLSWLLAVNCLSRKEIRE